MRNSGISSEKRNGVMNLGFAFCAQKIVMAPIYIAVMTTPWADARIRLDSGFDSGDDMK